MISKALVVGAYHKKLEELARLGVELHLVVPTTWGNQRLEILEGNGYTIHPLEIKFNGKNHFHLYQGLSQIIKEVLPEIVHIDEEHYSIATFQAMRLAKKAGAKSLFFTWQNIYKKYPFPFSYIERYNFEGSGIAIAGNEEAASVLRRKGFAKEIAVIPQFGVDPESFQRQDSSGLRERIGIKSNCLVVGFMGRLVEEKGILDLLEAISRVSVEHALLFIGCGPLQDETLEKAKKLGLESRVKIVDQVPSMEVPSYLNCFDCLVLPSLTRPNWKEQFGRVLIEAMACEVPVIGSDSGEIPNVIGDAGLVFHEGDAAGLAKKLDMLLTDGKLRESLGKKGRERVLAKFTQKQIAVDTYGVYRNLLESLVESRHE